MKYIFIITNKIFFPKRSELKMAYKNEIPTGKELKRLQDELVDTIITKPSELKKMIEIQLRAREGFHHYSLQNLILANYQLEERTGEGIELLAPYKVWEEKGRFVRKGEKALRVIAPVFKKYTNDKGEETEKLAYFMRVPVFDLSQTNGKKLEKDFTHGNKLNFTFEEIINRGKVKVNISHKELTRGYTNGKQIWVSGKSSNNKKICTYFHELAHYYLHFDKNRKEIKRPTRELEAEAVSYLVSSYLGIDDDEAPAYILHWTGSYSETERTELLKGKGSNVLKTATKIINDLKLCDLIDSKVNLNTQDTEIKVEV